MLGLIPTTSISFFRYTIHDVAGKQEIAMEKINIHSWNRLMIPILTCLQLNMYTDYKNYESECLACLRMTYIDPLN